MATTSNPIPLPHANLKRHQLGMELLLSLLFFPFRLCPSHHFFFLSRLLLLIPRDGGWILANILTHKTIRFPIF
jgi:hypothetical protein